MIIITLLKFTVTGYIYENTKEYLGKYVALRQLFWPQRIINTMYKYLCVNSNRRMFL